MSGEDEVGFQFLAENSTDLICCAGLNMALHYASPSSLQLLGWRPEEMIGKSLASFVLSEDAPALAAALGGTHSRVLETSSFNLRMKTRDGTVLWMEIKHRVLRDSETGDPTETVIVLRDVTSRMTLEDGPSASAFTDSVTGLSTHQAFLKALEREWNRAQRESSALSLLRLDFNDFRHFHGAENHTTGDGCLAKAAAAVTATIRMTDHAARYGAEGIAILLPFTDGEGAGRVVQKLRVAFGPLRSRRSTEAADRVPVSIGISTVVARSGGPMRMPEILLLSADHALHKSQHEAAKVRRPRFSDNTPGDASQCA